MAKDPPTITNAMIADVLALHALVQSAYRGESAKAGWTHEADFLDDERIDREALAAIIADPDQRLLLARRGDALVGCAQVARKSATHAYFGLFAVDPRLQGGGLGKRILDAAEAEGRRAFGVSHMEMTVIARRAELIAYYQRRGYRVTGETRPFPVVLDPPLTFAVLEKPLIAPTES